MIIRTINQLWRAYWMQQVCEKCDGPMPHGRYEHNRLVHQTLEQPTSPHVLDQYLPELVELDDELFDERFVGEMDIAEQKYQIAHEQGVYPGRLDFVLGKPQRSASESREQAQAQASIEAEGDA